MDKSRLSADYHGHFGKVTPGFGRILANGLDLLLVSFKNQICSYDMTEGGDVFEVSWRMKASSLLAPSYPNIRP